MITNYSISVGPLDGAGNGWAEILTHISELVSLIPEVQDPETGYAKIPLIAVSPREESVRVSITGGIPKSSVVLHYKLVEQD